MKKLLLLLSFAFSTISPIFAEVKADAKQLYNRIELSDVMPYELFEKIIDGYNKIEKEVPIITFLDFTKASSLKRLYVIDIKNETLLFNTYVSHGVNSGRKYATTFSNVEGTLKSSLGFLVTENTYQGKNGHSLRLRGVEEGINDNVKTRFIVMHSAKYSNPSRRNKKGKGKLGRSEGCLALPENISTEIIETIKDGSVIFIYAGSDDYAFNDQYLGE